MFGSGRFSMSTILTGDLPGFLQKLARSGTFLLFPVDRRACVLFAELSRENAALRLDRERRARDLSELAGPAVNFVSRRRVSG
jgi:hypothetical protein